MSGLVEVHCMAEVMALDVLCLLHMFHWNAMYLIPQDLGLCCQVGGNASKVRIHDVMYTFTLLVELSTQIFLGLCLSKVSADHRFLILFRTMSFFELHGKQKKTYLLCYTTPICPMNVTLLKHTGGQYMALCSVLLIE